jgi:putative acetyltransferase
VSPFVITDDDPRRDDVRALLTKHLALMRATSPPEDVHALDLDGLLADDVSFFSIRGECGDLLGVGALKRIDGTHVEIKSMHTAEARRGRGVGRAVLEHLLTVAHDRGYERISLETGSMDAFAPARALYASFGFVECDPFADYVPSSNSTFMTRAVGAPPARGRP